MTDFDPLSTIDEKQETDPVADFLDREQQQLAELNDFDGLASESSGADAKLEEPVFATENLDLFGQVPAAAENDDHLSANKDLRGMDEDSSRFDRYDALTEDGPPRIETDKIRQWQEEQKERLIIKDAESEKRQKEWIQVALLELEEYQRHREELLGKTKKSNRQAEDVFTRERDEKKQGAEWERVCRLCDFNPKTGTRTTKDVSRLRSLLLQLKQTPNATFVA